MLEGAPSSRAQISIAASFGCLALSFAQVASPACAQEPVRLTRTSEAIQVDGVIDEAQWQKIEPVPMVMYQPTYGGDKTERTEIRLAYDENFMYMAASLYILPGHSAGLALRVVETLSGTGRDPRRSL